MLQRTKYNRFRNDSVTSVDDLIHNLSMNSKVSSIGPTSTPSPYLVSPEVLQKDQDGPTAICTLMHKVSHLKLSHSGSLSGIKNLSSAVKELAASKLQGSSAAEASDNTCNLASATPSSQQDKSKMNTGKKTWSEEMNLGGEDWNQGSNVASKVSQGWLHSNEKILGPGVTYIVKYLGCIEVLRSMRSLDFNTRTQITREAISLVCDAVPAAKGAFKKRKPPSKALSSILGKSNLQFAGMSITLNISTTSLNLMTPDSRQIIANHHMQSISFASGVDVDTTDYVAYVAKDPVNRRACHILECSDGLAQDIISSIGQAFELRFKQYLQCPSKIPALHDRMQSLDELWMEEDVEAAAEHPYYNNIPNKIPPTGGLVDARLRAKLPSVSDPTQSASAMGREQTYYQSQYVRDLFGEDQQQRPSRQGSLDIYSLPEGKSNVTPPGEVAAYVNTQHINMEILQALQADAENLFSGTTESTKDSSPEKDLFDMSPFEDALKNQTPGPILNKATSVECTSPLLSRAEGAAAELSTEPWYQGEMSRKEAEQLLKKCGDFLVRKSTSNPGSYVLTGLHNGQAKHLLLVDPEGTVRTKDRIFDSISHLINHHLENNLPIVSSGSELCLHQPAEKKQ
ncbi:SHC-transforming protein 3 isoform X1 [Podarcis raffonei]|uniref:SHC-transforming protein 3 isoform X1 n=2 Tax=Podarcis raffonei TaxID=65483 RepID=UPI0023298468|nr:SHC-transforming protein 3 isoform X1 [Podarcis raffonei]XP_053264137.1 SHC-transforming protein 3 isoform X1 [Podarcis raffonei]